jgi:hypothetical protein
MFETIYGDQDSATLAARESMRLAGLDEPEAAIGQGPHCNGLEVGGNASVALPSS